MGTHDVCVYGTNRSCHQTNQPLPLSSISFKSFYFITRFLHKTQIHRCKIAVHEMLNTLPHILRFIIIIMNIVHGLTADYILTINSGHRNGWASGVFSWMCVCVNKGHRWKQETWNIQVQLKSTRAYCGCCVRVFVCSGYWWVQSTARHGPISSLKPYYLSEYY